MSTDSREMADDPEARLREMILATVEAAGGEAYLRKHGCRDLVPAYRRIRDRVLRAAEGGRGA